MAPHNRGLWVKRSICYHFDQFSVISVFQFSYMSWPVKYLTQQHDYSLFGLKIIWFKIEPLLFPPLSSEGAARVALAFLQ